jgi:hypothetical protein
MPKLFFVRDGIGTYQTGRGHTVAIQSLTALTAKYPASFAAGPWNFGSDPAKDSHPFKHVVAMIDDSEITAEFPKAGYYYFVGLSAKEAQRIFEVTGNL